MRQTTYPNPPYFRAVSQLGLLACIGVAVVHFGCATMALEKGRSTERVVLSRQERETGEPFTTRVTQDEQSVHLQVNKACALRSYDSVETTEHFTTVNKQPWRDWTAGIAGATLIGVGGWAIADAKNVYSNDSSSRTYNPYGPSVATGIGVGTIVAGAALLAIPVVDVLRAGHTEDGPPRSDERKGEIGGSCPNMPFGGAKIAGRFDNSGAEPINLGTTDSNGTLDINLAELSPPVPSGDIGGEPYGSSVTILVNGKQAGTASISAAYAAWRLGWETQKRQAHAAEAQRAEERAESERQGIERQKEREKQTAECNAGNGASCYSSHNYRRACDLGVQRACRIVNAPSEPAKPQATPEDAEVARVRENCTKGDQGACAAMSYANSCNDGSSDGCQALAIAYLRGGIGVARNTEHATGFFTLACRIDPGKCIAYGLEFYRGVSGFPRSVETGERFFDLACAGDAQQCAVLGSMYRTGNGVRRDPEKGMKYLERGCAANSPECCRLKGER